LETNQFGIYLIDFETKGVTSLVLEIDHTHFNPVNWNAGDDEVLTLKSQATD
jgi:hypothetical protein